MIWEQFSLKAQGREAQGPDLLTLGDNQDEGLQGEGLGSPLWDGETSLLPGRAGGQLSLLFTASRLDDLFYKSNIREGLGVPRPDNLPKWALRRH